MTPRFEGYVLAEWMYDDGRDRLMRLAAPFSFIDAAGTRWDVPTGAFIDGASIPRIMWSIADPFTGDYRCSSVPHDFYCQARTRSWQATHRMFKEAMLASGVGRIQTEIMFRAVWLFGPRWSIANG